MQSCYFRLISHMKYIIRTTYPVVEPSRSSLVSLTKQEKRKSLCCIDRSKWQRLSAFKSKTLRALLSIVVIACKNEWAMTLLCKSIEEAIKPRILFTCVYMLQQKKITYTLYMHGYSIYRTVCHVCMCFFFFLSFFFEILIPNWSSMCVLRLFGRNFNSKIIHEIFGKRQGI